MLNLKSILQDARDLTPQRKSELTKSTVMVGTVFVLVAIALIIATASKTVAAEHPLWEAVVQSRLALARIIMAVPMAFIGFGLAYLLYNVLENSDLGRRTVVPEEKDNLNVKAFKVSNAGFILASISVACILGMILAVCR